MNEDILAIGGFFTTVIVVSLIFGVIAPLIRSHIKRREQSPLLSPAEQERATRLERMETAIEAIAVEVERISESQRFVTKLLAERESNLPLPASGEERH